MIASLPMYDWPELLTAHDTLWQNIGDKLRDTGIDAPPKLSRRGGDESCWLDPGLLLGQTCGYPFSTVLKDKVQYVATPIYEVEGCSGPYYSSAIVARQDSVLTTANWQRARFAYNGPMSLSGYRAIKAMVGEPESFFATITQSGGHRISARMVAKGNADIAALDAVCWHLLQQHEPATAKKLNVIGWSDRRPALPLITSLETSPEVVARLREVLAEISPPGELAISGFEVMEITEYERLAGL